MEFVLTASEMKKCDETAINNYGIESLVLMERAAYGTACAIIEKYGKDIFVGIMAGSGNNGGDGIAIARILQEEGIRVEINMIGDTKKLTIETKRQLEIAQKLNIPVYYGVEHTLYDVIVDSVFGVGLTRNVEGKYRKAVEAINASKAKIVSVDVPSGVNSDDGSIMGCAVKADMTVTYAYRKIGIMLYPGAACAGEIKCIPIGIPKAIMSSKRTGVVTFTDKNTDLRLPGRKSEGNKSTFGKVLLIAGSKNMGGACQLSALSAFRMGAGMVKVYTAEENREIMLKKIPEVMVDTYADDANNELSNEEIECLKKNIEWASVIAIGPGLSTSPRAKMIMEILIENNRKPLVIDADALNILAENDKLLKKFEFNRKNADYDVVMTPHLGEFARLLHCPVAEIKKDMLSSCKAFTKKYDVSLVCKDARTIITKRGKLTYLNSSGNEGMATAGAGDVLTGMIVGLLAQKPNGFEAAVMGTYAHGLAGDIARDNSTSYYIMAQDIIQSIKEITK